MTAPSLFHLHFNTPDVAGAADRLDRAGVPLERRFGSVRGEGASLGPDEAAPEGFRLKLQVHQRGAVNVTLAPGRRPRFDHLGLSVENAEDVIDRAESRGWSVRSNDRRTFVMTPWGFRVELHRSTADVVTELGEPEEARLEDVTLWLSDATAARDAFDGTFDPIPELHIRSGDGPWVDSFDVVGRRATRSIDVATLLGATDPPA